MVITDLLHIVDVKYPFLEEPKGKGEWSLLMRCVCAIVYVKGYFKHNEKYFVKEMLKTFMSRGQMNLFNIYLKLIPKVKAKKRKKWSTFYSCTINAPNIIVLKYRVQKFLSSNHSVKTASENAILSLIFLSWKVIGYSKKKQIEDF